MKVLLFHPVLLPPKDYGGVERVVLWLTKGLLERGVDVTVAALSGSHLPKGAKLLEIAPGHASAVDLCSRVPKGIDLIHFMAPPEEKAMRDLDIPWMLTVHGNGKLNEEFPLNTAFLTADHAKRHGAECFVYNGIDPAEYVFNGKPRKAEHLFLSKTGWKVKNVKGAIRLCKRAKTPLAVAGGWRPLGTWARSFLTRGIRWIGPVSGSRKATVLSEAQTLVFPVLWPEPFGLVVAEALISGTPVLASPRGGLGELVPAQVGRLCSSEEEWIDALTLKSGFFEPEHCREWAMKMFHYQAMAGAYVSLYHRVIAGEKLNSRAPRSKGWELG